ncbi:hypothetical protein EV702DRAFT_1264299 [Suillus placidus]|uniref:Myb-like domain-containing protein n=1 Tax=Suillus placidus TaxID=48579 RepID=A0A9P7A897_9AGAM|nr:hypothetical protein EV702DRAFT_1264299 [Suillus placidus]
MSTRVQKGSTVFRPVAKARPRPAEVNAPKQLVSIPEVRPSIQPSSQQHAPTAIAVTPLPPPVASLSMPPPIVVPVRPPITTVQIPQPLPAHPVILIPPPVEPESGRKRGSQLRASSEDPKKSRKTRAPSLPYDASVDPGEGLDPTAVTMATLCEDTGWGRVSSKAAQIVDNHLVWKKTNREMRARMRVSMEARKYGRNEDDTAQTGQSSSAPAAISAGPSPVPTNDGHPTVGDTSGSGFDYSQDVATSRYNVQIRIGPNGETIIDEESLFVDRNVGDETADYTHVEESDVSKFVNSGTYGRRFRGSRWSAEETELFYDALSQFGENYELISYVLPGRDRKSCKNKFKAEDKKNSARINYCLNNRQPYANSFTLWPDMQTLSRMTGKDFSGPTPEIRPPPVLTLAEPEGDEGAISKKPDQTPALEDDGEEVLGDISSYL